MNRLSGLYQRVRLWFMVRALRRQGGLPVMEAADESMLHCAETGCYLEDLPVTECIDEHGMQDTVLRTFRRHVPPCPRAALDHRARAQAMPAQTHPGGLNVRLGLFVRD